MIKFNKVVLTTDLSSNADAAAPYAIELARHYGGTVYLLHVFEDTIYFSADGLEGPNVVDWLESAYDEHERRLKERARTLPTTENVSIVPVMLRGQPASRIAAFAKEKGADCIVIATHGRTGLSRFVFGSVTERVMHMSPCPVVTVHPDVIVPERPEMMETAGVGSADEDIIL